jgi:HPt (histidine-containing phosphotransfer) domain-containing protein
VLENPFAKEPTFMLPVESPLDREVLDETAEFGLDDLQETIAMYLKQADEIMGGLRTAVQTGAANNVNELAHKLAGSSAVCGVAAMVQPLRALEQHGREGRLSGSDKLLAETTERLELCRRLLADYLAEKGCP